MQRITQYDARKYLTYTTYSVSEIACLLHFDYPTTSPGFLESTRAFPQPNLGKGNQRVNILNQLAW